MSAWVLKSKVVSLVIVTSEGGIRTFPTTTATSVLNPLPLAYTRPGITTRSGGVIEVRVSAVVVGVGVGATDVAGTTVAAGLGGADGPGGDRISRGGGAPPRYHNAL